MAEPSRFERVTLRNGTRAIRELESGEVMHPSVGPWAEARALYVEQSRLADRLSAEGSEPVVVWDVGLGGAANAAAALSCAAEVAATGRSRRPLELVSFERDLQPLALSLEDPEGFPFLVPFAEAARTLLRDGRWESIESGAQVRWTLHAGDVREAWRGLGLGLNGDALKPEVVFFDPFSPETNTALWTPETFTELRALMREDGPGSLLLTYSASTRTRVSMLLGGLYVGVGMPIGGKRETTLAATRRELLEQPLDARWLERWRRSSARAPWGRDEAAGSSSEEDARITAHPQFAHAS